MKHTTWAKAAVLMLLRKEKINQYLHSLEWNNHLSIFELSRGHLSIVEIYAHNGKDDENEKCYLRLQHILNEVNLNDFITILGDFNAWIGYLKIDTNISIFDEQTRCNNGLCLIFSYLTHWK